MSYGKLRGLILRSQLITLLQHKIFNEVSEAWTEIRSDMFRDNYPRYPTIEVSCNCSKPFCLWPVEHFFLQEVVLTEKEKTYSIDLTPFMNRSPYTVLHVSATFFKHFFFSIRSK